MMICCRVVSVWFFSGECQSSILSSCSFPLCETSFRVRLIFFVFVLFLTNY